ncbi:MAG: hypothetical protein KAY22_02295 [Rhizorhabdus sp.]|uniref:hypothetical protein n=1 Tax=Rhizorhabdus sp. TaxID=1968843 RepID=UPI001B5E1530|nr:hypothetical protein [Rhizorhabdus sp.]MBP8231111.1 hypothetical protein [Rhizorhabdus sp.]
MSAPEDFVQKSRAPIMPAVCYPDHLLYCPLLLWAVGWVIGLLVGTLPLLVGALWRLIDGSAPKLGFSPLGFFGVAAVVVIYAGYRYRQDPFYWDVKLARWLTARPFTSRRAPKSKLVRAGPGRIRMI